LTVQRDNSLVFINPGDYSGYKMVSDNSLTGGRKNSTTNFSADNSFLQMGDDIATAFYQKYEPKDVLGRGASSTVRRCIQKETGEQFAVKIIDVSQQGQHIDADGLDVREQTFREVQILRMVQGHENIIELVDVFESSTYIFLVFELCNHGELFDYLTTQVTLSEKSARRIMKQIFAAVRHCHSKHIVHRDIKPENILLDKDHNVKLTDFGFAKVIHPGERLFEVCGTPGYLAPELLRSGMVERDECNGYGIEVDIWACRVILYTLLVGFPPFWHRKQLLMLRSIMEGRYSFSNTEWMEVTQAPKDLISKILVVDYESRPSVDQCLNHEFFRYRRDSMSKPSAFKPRLQFKRLINCVRFIIRLTRLKSTPQPISLRTVHLDPYRVRTLRKQIDGAAFRIYGHWVKKNDGQNRAAMFEHIPKVDVGHKPSLESEIKRAVFFLQAAQQS